MTQLLGGVVFLGIAWIHLAAADPTGWDRFIGGSAALMSGLNFGVVGTLRLRRVVRQQLDRDGNVLDEFGPPPA